MKKTFNIIWNIVFFGILLALGALFFLPIIPVDKNIQIKIVQSGSMEPAIMTGGMVVVRPVAEYGIGDVITFEGTTEFPTTHRIVALSNDGQGLRYVTKGDANEEADAATVSLQDVIGKVILDVPYAGFVLDFARKPLGFALLIVLPALMIVLDEIEKIWKEYRRLKKPKTGNIPVTRVPKRGISSAVATVDASVVKQIQARPLLRRERAMDIRPPVRVVPMPRPTLVSVPRYDASPKKDNPNNDWAVASCIALVFSGAVFCVGMLGSTISYLSDIESALANTLNAIAVDFTVSGDESQFAFDDNEGSVISVVEPEKGSVDMRYTVRAQMMSGVQAFCDALTAEVAAPPFTYPEGPLLLLAGDDVDFAGPWTLDIGLLPGTYVGGDQCVVDIVYTAYVAEGVGGVGYSDEERQTLTFTAPGIAPLLESFFFSPQAAEGDIPPTLPFGSTTEEASADMGTTTDDSPQGTSLPPTDAPPAEEQPLEEVPPALPPIEDTPPEEVVEGVESPEGEIPEPEPEEETEPEPEPEEEPTSETPAEPGAT